MDWNWLCSNSSMVIIDSETQTIGDCFIQSVFKIPTFVLFIAFNAYLCGKNHNLSRHFNHISIKSIRLCSIFLLLLQLVFVYLNYFFTNHNLNPSSAVLVSDIFQLFAFIFHTLLLLNKNLFDTYPTHLFVSFIFVTISNLIYLINQIILFKYKLEHNTYDKYDLINFVILSLQNLFLIVYVLIVILSYTVNYCKFPRLSSQSRLGENIQFDESSHMIDEDISDEDKASYLSYITFKWLQPVMTRGYKREIDSIDHLSKLPNDLDVTAICKRFMSKYSTNKMDNDDTQNPIINPDLLRSVSTIDDAVINIEFRPNEPQQHVSKRTLIKSLLKCFGRQFFILGIFKLINDSLGFAGPLLLNKLVEFIEDKEADLKVGCTYAGALFLSTLLASLINTHFTYSLNKLCLRIKASLISLIYRKAVLVQVSELNNYSIGQIVNFMSIDSDAIVNAFPSVHAFWSLPFQIAVTLYLLYTEIGISFLVGVGFVIILIPINKFISDYIGKVHQKFMSYKDSRVKIMTEFLHGIRVIKFYTWETFFMNKINEVREKELKQLKAKKYLDAFCVYFWASTPILMSVFTFTTYVLLGNKLTPAKVFTSLALFNMLISPLNSFPWVVNGMIQAWVSLKRLQGFLNLKNLDWLHYYTLQGETGNGDQELINLRDSTFKWDKSEKAEEAKNKTNNAYEALINDDTSQEEHPTLSNLNIKIEKSKLIGVIGRVGSGKSSFLNTILSEITKLDGEIDIDRNLCAEGFAYVCQESWIQATTIRENILFGKDYDEERYRQVIEACALIPDLQLLPKGHETPVGENGITLSGGQKARLCLARACYQDKEVYLLDDPLSAVDTHVAKHLYEKCINGLLSSKTRILCTHHLKYLQNADYVYVLDNGRIIKEGVAGDIIPEYMNSSLIKTENQNEMDEVDLKDENVQTKELINTAIDAKEKLDEIELKEKDEEEREHGVIENKVYKYYCLSIGVVLSVVVILSITLMQASRNATDWWLSYWTQHHLESNVNYTITAPKMSYLTNYAKHKTLYVLNPSVTILFRPDGFVEKNETRSTDDLNLFFIVYGSICGANSLFTLFRAFSFAYSCILAAKYIHNSLIISLIKAPIRFFDITPRGRILNRLSSDIYAIDDSLPFVLNICLACFFSLIGVLVVTCYSLPWFSIALIPLGIIYYTIQNYYRWTSRELKRLTSVSLSPIYNHFHETLTGLVTIRAFREIKRFLQHNEDLLKVYTRASYVSTAASQWLNFRLQMIGVAMISLVGFTGVMQHLYGTANASLIGLALSYILSVTGLLNGLINSFTETEKEMVSVERTHQFENLDKENWNGVSQADSEWPIEANIQFQDVVLRYHADARNALDLINLYIRGGEKIGIVGRTGSGKSSLFMALFRAFELDSGKIFIDGVDIRTLDLVKLREKMSIIPQDPFLFNGTLRDNLDPNKKRSDEDIWQALNRCRLEDKIRQLDNGLESIVEERGKNYSSGEKQLICLARAILSRTKILCIDEATASVDFETDNFIQQTIREQFKNVTVLTIAHRINTIFDYDKVIVIDNSKLVEFDTVQNLLLNKQSKFYDLVHSEQKKVKN